MLRAVDRELDMIAVDGELVMIADTVISPEPLADLTEGANINHGAKDTNIDNTETRISADTGISGINIDAIDNTETKLEQVKLEAPSVDSDDTMEGVLTPGQTGVTDEEIMQQAASILENIDSTNSQAAATTTTVDSSITTTHAAATTEESDISSALPAAATIGISVITNDAASAANITITPEVSLVPANSAINSSLTPESTKPSKNSTKLQNSAKKQKSSKTKRGKTTPKTESSGIGGDTVEKSKYVSRSAEVSEAAVKRAEGEEDTWDAMFDEEGDCLDEDMVKEVSLIYSIWRSQF